MPVSSYKVKKEIQMLPTNKLHGLNFCSAYLLKASKHLIRDQLSYLLNASASSGKSVKI